MTSILDNQSPKLLSFLSKRGSIGYISKLVCTWQNTGYDSYDLEIGQTLVTSSH